MHDRTEHTIARLDRFLSERIEPARWRRRAPLTVTAWQVPDEPVPFSEAVGQPFEEFAIGQGWARPWGTTWFRVQGGVPGEWAEQSGTAVELLVDLGFSGSGPGFQAEATAYTPDGVILKGIEPRNHHVPTDARPGEPVDVFVEAAANPSFDDGGFRTPTPMGDKETAGAEPLYRLRSVEVALRDLAVAELHADLLTLRGLLDELPATNPRRAEILAGCERVINAVDPDDVPGTAAAGRAELAGLLAAPAYASAHRVHAVGHAHIDSAWLWPTRETVRKCARTFSNVIELLETRPGWRFAASSAQQYAWIKEHYPELFERIRAQVDAGGFVPAGGMWVESDTNLPGGEAMARQFVLGTRWFIDELGVEPLDVWLPDSFGYSGSLPGIATAAGKRWFLTQKISWNDTNTMPHHTFWWEGIDGRRIFTHFPPVDTYNSDLSAADLARAERQYAEKGRANTSLVPFGYGDGGGGPTREMLAAAARTADLEGSPKVTLSSPAEFFTAAEEEYADPPVWRGEMYLEFHRGTYTSQHRTKAGNRRSEHLLREAELWATTAAVRTGRAYPAEELDHWWRIVLLQQFHDILPGSSIAWVHREAERNYAEVARGLEQIIADSLAALGSEAGSQDGVLANAGPFPVRGVPALGVGRAEDAVADARIRVERAGTDWVLTGPGIRAVVDEHGRLTSVRDLAADREVLAPDEPSARLVLHRDVPNRWDAWDVDHHYRQVSRELDEPTVIEPLADGLRITFVTGRSEIVETVRLADDRPAIELELELDWHEQQQLLKLDFALDVHAEQATSEIQFGHLQRPTHENTSWDAARFETVAHRWMQVGEPGYGVALANDCSYGFDCTRTTRGDGGTTTRLGVSVVRAPLFPDPEADQGRHRLAYTLRVGAGVAEAIEEGYRLNLPLRTAPGSGAAPLVSIDDPAVVIEAVKLAEDGSGDVVVRCYESRGGRARARVTADFEIVEVLETDLLERPIEPRALRAVDGPVATLELRPFQLCTLRFRRTPTSLE
ncbi:alpha-mannosidase [Enemella evansiae]|uniref:alpha-mannosidase n=1 Tax=Enemella evansiae TaxID=2016499 RepID=UPI000B97BB17|nr:glycoside hydrolase family 38 C-terminal domain-containing protein [Enemella evansiae]OYO03010.1 alpha-mannosidase [Enemella evansiae]